MKADISSLQVGAKFRYKGYEFIVEGRDLEFLETRCLTDPNPYSPLNVLFATAGQVEVENV